MGYKVVVAGATGNVGREMLNILDERQFPVDEIAVLASRRSQGTEVSFGDKTLKIQDIEQFDFTGWDIALFAIGSDATRIHAPRAAQAGCLQDLDDLGIDGWPFACQLEVGGGFVHALSMGNLGSCAS